MRSYPVPPDMSEPEKIFNGLLTGPQVAWIVSGLIIATAVFLIFFPLMGKFALILAIPFCFTGLPFAFVKVKEDLTLFQYLKRKVKFEKSQHLYPNKRKID